jgi:hypothetical protein
MSKIAPLIPKSHGVARVDDRRVNSDVICVVKHGLQRSAKPIKQSSRIKGILARLKGWRRITMRFDSRADVLMAAITITAIVTWWLQ